MNVYIFQIDFHFIYFLVKHKSKATTSGRLAGCQIESQCKDGVRADSMSSLIIAAGERCGLLGVGF